MTAPRDEVVRRAREAAHRFLVAPGTLYTVAEMDRLAAAMLRFAADMASGLLVGHSDAYKETVLRAAADVTARAEGEGEE